MKFEVLLSKLRKLNFPPDQFAVMSSGVLAVRGLREAKDLDLIVTQKLWKRLSAKYPVRKHAWGYFISLGRHIEVLGGRLDNQKKDLNESERQIKKADIIDEVRYVKLREVLTFKKRLGRKKDIRDIKLIVDYLRMKGT